MMGSVSPCGDTRRAAALLKGASISTLMTGDPGLTATTAGTLPEDEETCRLRRRAEILNLGGRSREGAGLLTPAPEKT